MYVAGTCSASGALFVLVLAILAVTIVILRVRRRRSTPSEPDKGTIMLIIMITINSRESTNVQSTMTKLVLSIIGAAYSV